MADNPTNEKHNEKGETSDKPYELLKASFVRRRGRLFVRYWVMSTILWVASIFPVIDFLRPRYTVNDWYYALIDVYMFLFLGIHWASLFVVLRLMGLVCPNCGADFLYLNISPPNGEEAPDASTITHCPKCGAEIVDIDA